MTKSKPIQERYRWEAEKTNGEIITTGGDLTACVRVSFIPEVIGSRKRQLQHMALTFKYIGQLIALQYLHHQQAHACGE